MMKIEILSFAVLSFLILGCSEDQLVSDTQLETSSNDQTVVTDESTFSENLFSQLTYDVNDALAAVGFSFGRHRSGGFGFGFSDCIETTEESPEGQDYPLTITLNYIEGCSSNFVEKSGQITILITDDPEIVGSQRIVTFENYVVNGYEIDGVQTYTNNGNRAFTSTLTGGSITTPEGEVISIEQNRERTLIAGAETEDTEDDVYQITGFSSVTDGDGVSYSRTIIQPLIAPRDCFWIVEGTIETINEEGTTLIDFGDGTCDDLATRTADGETEEFTMDFRVKRFGRRG